jgi:hypothetical protein
MGRRVAGGDAFPRIRRGDVQMKAIKATGILLVGFCAVPVFATTESGHDQLLRLGKELHALRGAPIGLKSVGVCPNGPDLAVLIGLQRRDIPSTLGEPDNCFLPLGRSCERSRARVYVFVNSKELPRELRGGGFPGLTFEFDESDAVIAASCHYAR